MSTRQKCIAIIPARGGSKGLPRKNVLPLGGKPMIAWPCDAATKTPELDLVVCSTDDDEIAEAAREAGAEVPFIRPAHLATDRVSVIDVIQHTLLWYQDQGSHYDYVLLLQSTSPFVFPSDIQKALHLAFAKEADTVIACVSAEANHPAIMFQRSADGKVIPMIPKLFCGARRQEFTPYFMRVGAFYVIRTDLILERKALYGDKIYAQLFPAERAVNIDDARDYAWAEFLLERYGDTWR